MMRQIGPQKNNRLRTGGFTLLELLVAMTIIAILIALLTPAIFSAIQNARETEVRTEINQLESALSAFKAKYGQYPPSRITLYLGTANWDADPESKSVIRRFWPEFNFAINTTGDTVSDVPWTDGTTLNGAECLVFFLGGVNETAGSVNLIGFSKNPANPFSRAGSTRDRPLFEFEAGRLAFSPNLVYLDPLSGQTNPYIYISSDEGQGYDTTDYNGAMTNIYTQTGGKAWKAESFQIISPGRDRVYGPGGFYSTDKADTALVGNGDVDGDDTPDGVDRTNERDNITNFNTGRLAP